MTHRWLPEILWLIAWSIAYTIPWATTSGSSLTLNAYDLAEWTSLNPVVRNASVSLLPTLALRLLPALIVIWYSQHTELPRYIRLLLVFIVGIGLLPPLEFFFGNLNDPNFRQQFGIAIFAVLSGALLTLNNSLSWQRLLRLSALLLILTLGVIGLVISVTSLSAFEISIQLGFGGILFIALAAWRGIQEIKKEVTLKLPH